MKQGRYGLGVLALLGGARRSDRVLVVAGAATRKAALLPEFDHPVTIAGSLKGGSSGSFDVVIAEHGAGFDTGALLRTVRPDGAVVLVDAAPAESRLGRLTRRLTNAGRAVRAATRALGPRGFVRQKSYVAEPDVTGLRRVRDAALPQADDTRRKVADRLRRLVRHEQRFAVAFASGRATALESALSALGGSNGAEKRDTVAVFDLCRLSGTHVLLFRVSDSIRGEVLIRFPLNDVGGRRAAHHHAALEQLQRLGYALAPVPVGLGSGNGFPFFAERALPGAGLPSSISAMNGEAVVTHVSAALDALERLHTLSGRSETLDETAFERHVGARIESLRRSVRARGLDDQICRQIAAALKNGMLGKRSRIGFCHGDPWLPNYLFDGSRVSGVIDWDMSEPEGCCTFDVAVLVTSTLLQWTGSSVEQLLRSTPEPYRSLEPRVAAYHARTQTDGLGFREAVLCYWLDRVARHEFFGRLSDEWFDRHVAPMTGYQP